MSRAFILATLTRLGACDDGPDDALPWARALPEDTTPERAWAACERGDWLVWLLGKLHVAGLLAREVLVLAACAAARTALPHLAGHVAHAPALAAVETAERWAGGEATAEEVREAANAADTYLDAAIAARATAHAADATCLDATLAAFATAHAAASSRLACPSAHASNAASRAADAAYAAAYDAAEAAAASDGVHARARRLVEIGVAVRSVVPWRTVAAALGGLSAHGTA